MCIYVVFPAMHVCVKYGMSYLAFMIVIFDIFYRYISATRITLFMSFSLNKLALSKQELNSKEISNTKTNMACLGL